MLRATVVMKTDISGSTPRFRSLLAADLQSLLDEHQALLARCAAGQGGNIVKAAEAGEHGEPGQFRDYAIPRPGYRAMAAAA